MDAVIPVAIKVVFDETGSLLVALANQETGTIRVEPLAFRPAFYAILKRCDNSGAQDAADFFEQVLTAAAVNNDIAFQGRLENDQLYQVQIEELLGVKGVDKMRGFSSACSTASGESP